MTPALVADAAGPLFRWAERGLWLALGALTGLVLVLAALAPDWLPLLPLALVGATAFVLVLRDPFVGFCATMGLFAVVSRFKAGFQVEEIVFAALYMSFLALWFARRIWVERAPLVRHAGDAVLVGFLVLVTASFGLAFVFGNALTVALSEWINFSMLAFYFPARSLVAKHRWGLWLVPGVLLYFGTFASVRNLMILREALNSAEAAWQIAAGRVPMNEMLLLAAAMLCLLGALYVGRVSLKLGLTVAFGGFTLALILTQGRAYWVDLFVGVVVVFLAVNATRKLQMGIVGALGSVLLVGALLVLFGEFAELLLAGLVDRLLSIGTATTMDISLLNRFIETDAAMGYILRNPILGYGLGSEYGFYDAIYQLTMVKSFIHNGFLYLWFKFGVFGLLAVLFIWGRAIRVAFRVYRERARPVAHWALALFGGATLISIIPSHASAATFSTSDTVLVFTLLIALVDGLRMRGSDAAEPPERASA